MLIIYLIIIIVVFVCLRMILLSLLGVSSVNNLRIKDSVMECRNGRLSDAYNELGISLIINDLEKYDDMTSLLSLDLNKYEVIVMLDFSSHPLASKITQDFDMIKIDKIPTRELSCMALRGVYRSRESRYSRLVVVDMNRGSCSQRFNCGANIARYEYVMAIENGCKVAQGAICSAVRTFMEHGIDQKVCAVGGFKVGKMPKNPLAFIDMSVKTIISGGCINNFSNWGQDLSVIFNREYLISAGGYGVDKEYDYELFMRMKRMNERTKDNGESILMPKVFLFDRNSTALRYTRSMLPSSFIFGFLFILSLLCVMTRFTVLVALTLAFCYATSTLIAMVCLCGTQKMYKHNSSLKLVFSSILYPLYLIFRLFRRVRF